MVFPGGIDAHVHGRDPGAPTKENFETMTASAAVGGVTTVLEMPNTVPAVDTLERFHAKAEHLGSLAHVDFGLWGLLRATSTPDQLRQLADAGAVGVKAFLGYAFDTRRGQVLYSPDATEPAIEAPPTYGTLLHLGAELAASGMPLAVHAEDPGALLAASAPVETYADLLRARPAAAEAIAIAAVGVVSQATGVDVHVVHLSSAMGLAAAVRAVNASARLTVETCPQYLLLTDADYARVGSIMKVYPPVRELNDRDALRRGLLDGSVALIASDHAPHTDAEKVDVPLGRAAAGSPGVQSLLLSALEVATLHNDIALAARWVCEAPAKRFGLYPRKGCIAVGSDADLAIVDLESTTRIDATTSRSLQHRVALEGLELHAAIRSVYVRGQQVAEEGELVDSAPAGQWIRPVR